MSAVRTASTVLKKDFMKEVLILLGTNLGDKRENLAKAIESIGRFGKIHRTSARYESPAWGYESTASYFNQVLLLHTAIEPEVLMQGLLAVEQELGRERLAEGYADRLIDIDILSIDRLVQQTALLGTAPSAHAFAQVYASAASRGSSRLDPSHFRPVGIGAA